MHLQARLGDEAVVRSDDIDGNDIIGTVTVGEAGYHFRATATDEGQIVSSEIEPR